MKQMNQMINRDRAVVRSMMRYLSNRAEEVHDLDIGRAYSGLAMSIACGGLDTPIACDGGYPASLARSKNNTDEAYWIHARYCDIRWDCESWVISPAGEGDRCRIPADRPELVLWYLEAIEREDGSWLVIEEDYPL